MLFQRVAHLEALLQENQSLSGRELHDSRVRTLCICEPRKVDLDKVMHEVQMQGVIFTDICHPLSAV